MSLSHGCTYNKYVLSFSGLVREAPWDRISFVFPRICRKYSLFYRGNLPLNSVLFIYVEHQKSFWMLPGVYIILCDRQRTLVTSVTFASLPAPQAGCWSLLRSCPNVCCSLQLLKRPNLDEISSSNWNHRNGIKNTSVWIIHWVGRWWKQSLLMQGAIGERLCW